MTTRASERVRACQSVPKRAKACQSVPKRVKACQSVSRVDIAQEELHAGMQGTRQRWVRVRGAARSPSCAFCSCVLSSFLLGSSFVPPPSVTILIALPVLLSNQKIWTHHT